jgi:hypothetical protein
MNNIVLISLSNEELKEIIRESIAEKLFFIMQEPLAALNNPNFSKLKKINESTARDFVNVKYWR